MRYEKGHADTTRQRILEVASRRFREHGVAAAGIAPLMADAGLTNGAFYTHFESKEALFRQVLIDMLAKRQSVLRKAIAEGNIDAAIQGYLSTRHRDNPGNGCVTSSLAAEVARHPVSTREVFSTMTSGTIDLIATQMKGETVEARRSNAIAVYGMMVGALQLARAASDPAFSDEILQSGIQAALTFVDGN
jgi:TetR/AcrR family transcriptional repressor of nem operon